MKPDAAHNPDDRPVMPEGVHAPRGSKGVRGDAAVRGRGVSPAAPNPGQPENRLTRTGLPPLIRAPKSDAAKRRVVKTIEGIPPEAAATTLRDPFADDVLERLVRSNQDYQRSHGHYIVPLAERLLEARREIADLKKRLGYPEFAR